MNEANIIHDLRMVIDEVEWTPERLNVILTLLFEMRLEDMVTALRVAQSQESQAD